MPGLFRDLGDPDEKRTEILWMAVGFIIILAAWLAVVLIFGFRPLSLGVTYDEVVMSIGLGVLILCSVFYLVGREREQRMTNRRLLTELRDTVSLLDQRVKELNGLCASSAELAGSLDIDYISSCTVASLVGAMGADWASLVLFEEELGHMIYARDSQGLLVGGEGSLSDPSAAWPAPLLGGDILLQDLDRQVQAWNADKRLLCVPFRLKNGLAGVLSVRQSRGFDCDDYNASTTLANMAAKAIESAQHHAELRESYLSTVRSLVYSLEARDNYTATHGQRVASLALRMAERLGLPEPLVRDIENFAPLHDVGKIGIRDAILLKPFPLNDEERAICREHAIIGERIVRPLKPSPEALAMVRHHHESWGGGGYPDGLVGTSIPLLARLIQVADCYDAMISDRPYRPTISDDEVQAHFIMERGRRYDPEVVDALLARLDRGQVGAFPIGFCAENGRAPALDLE